MKAEIKNNRAYCPICHERNYKVLADKHRTVETSKGTAIEFTARCKCGQVFTYLAIINIDDEIIFTEQEEVKKMKTYIGEVSVAASLSFIVEAESEEEAKEKIFNANCPIDLVDDKGKAVCEITDQQWHLVDETARGNIAESDIHDFYIEEEN